MAGCDWLIERHTHKALRREVVDLCRLRRFEQADARPHVGKVEFHQMQIRMLEQAQFIDAPEINRTGATIGAVDGVTLGEELLR
jgi:hypothetical protein